MNTNSELDRIVSSWLEDRVADPPHGSLQSALARADQTPQQHHRWLQWWFGRGHGATGSAAAHGRMTPTNDRRNLLMFSTIAATAAAAALALVAMLTLPQGTVEPEPPPAAVGSDWSVAATGGDFSTISEAVEAAADGDTILIEPGVYEEAFTIEEDITLAGNGDGPLEVTIRIPADAPAPALPLTPYRSRGHGFKLPEDLSVGIQLIDTDATVRNLQVVGSGDDIDMLVSGGAPALEDLILKHDGTLELNASLAGGLFVENESSATIDNSRIWHRARISGDSEPIFTGSTFENARITIQDGSAPVITDGVIRGECVDDAITVIGGSSPTFRGNLFTHAELAVRGAVDDDTRALIEDNQFTSSDLVAITISDGASATIERNTLSGNTQAVSVSHSSALIRGNSFSYNANAITLSNAHAEVADNVIRGGSYAVSIVHAGAPLITGNTIEDATMRGILVGGGTSPIIEGNRICGSEVNLYIQPNSDPTLGDNDICPDGTAMAE